MALPSVAPYLLVTACIISALLYAYSKQKSNKTKNHKKTELSSHETNCKPSQHAENVESAPQPSIICPSRILLIYGSQTGTAEAFAKRLGHDIDRKFGLPVSISNAEEVHPKTFCEIPRDTLTIFIISTHGEGEPADDARVMFRWMSSKKRESGCLSRFQFAVMGLGNSQYTQFNEAGRRLERCLLKLGAQRICDRGEGDDDYDVEADFDLWVSTKLFPSLCLVLDHNLSLGATEDAIGNWTALPEVKVAQFAQIIEHVDGKPDMNSLFELATAEKTRLYSSFIPVKVLKSEELRQSTSNGLSTRSIDLCQGSSFGHDILKYCTADDVEILPVNPHELVARAFNMLSKFSSPSSLFLDSIIKNPKCENYPFPCSASIRQILQLFCDLKGPVERSVLRSLASFTLSAEEKGRVASLLQNSSDFTRLIRTPKLNIVDALELLLPETDFNQSHLSFVTALLLFSRQKPRSFTGASSSLAKPHLISIVVSKTIDSEDAIPSKIIKKRLVDGGYAAASTIWKPERSKKFEGLCSTYLCSEAPNQSRNIIVLARIKSSSLKLPNSTKPLLMVAAGSGIAPFIGYLQELEFKAALSNSDSIKRPSEVVLCFGCTNSNRDFLFKNELKQFLTPSKDSDPILTQFWGAFSREQQHKVYVQDKLLENAPAVKAMLDERQGMIFICGSVKMGQGVKDALKDILGYDSFNRLMISKRLVEEVWT